MKIFYADSLGFDVLDAGLGGKRMPPPGAVTVSDDEYIQLFAGQALGQRILADDAGRPYLADPLPPTSEMMAASERIWRDRELAASDGMVARHRDELESELKPSLLKQHYAELQTYRKRLRDWPQSGKFPQEEHRPEAPTWISELMRSHPRRM
ncbi:MULTISPECIES: phage tail assembly chaperone [Pseudomonas]|uniref:phage tail assembly chaperone n=1 Tax=Pseudomonas TaxID=286 RepID=UPI000D8AFE2F|nr:MULTISPECIES: phage tail assembly chaperone [Pseudomonas]MCP3788926.1 phage tail assembly chaperone [Pseudomonas sp. N2-11]PYB93572.1 phage tail protein [Pseudomonas fulva]PYC16397.1 phage tail protein [Pseudomonas fulva]